MDIIMRDRLTCHLLNTISYARRSLRKRKKRRGSNASGASNSSQGASVGWPSGTSVDNSQIEQNSQVELQP